jgi:hypothetical protein
MKWILATGIVLGILSQGVLLAQCENGQCPYYRNNQSNNSQVQTQNTQQYQQQYPQQNHRAVKLDREIAESDFVDDTGRQGYTVEKYEYSRHGVVESAAPSDRMNSHRISVPQYFHGCYDGDCVNNWYEYTDTEWPTKFEDSWMEDLIR